MNGNIREWGMRSVDNGRMRVSCGRELLKFYVGISNKYNVYDQISYVHGDKLAIGNLKSYSRSLCAPVSRRNREIHSDRYQAVSFLMRGVYCIV